MIDYTGFFNTQDFEVKTVLKATFKLTEDDIINAIRSEVIHINGRMYKVPKMQLWDAMRQKILYSYNADTFELTLTEIKDEKANNQDVIK